LVDDGGEAILARAVHILFGTFFVMEARPELVTHARLSKRVMKRGRQREFWHPNVIGEHYRVRYEGSTNGTHASPRIHWVRGFYRNQPFGLGRSDRRLVWIEPFMRGSAA
jgi:hypothetical protein